MDLSELGVLTLAGPLTKRTTGLGVLTPFGQFLARGIGALIRGRRPTSTELSGDFTSRARARSAARLALATALVPVLIACNQNTAVLTSVQKMVATTDAAAPSYAAIAADFEASCRRQLAWTTASGPAVTAGTPRSNRASSPTGGASSKHSAAIPPPRNSANKRAVGPRGTRSRPEPASKPAPDSGGVSPSSGANDPPSLSPSQPGQNTSAGAVSNHDPCALSAAASNQWQKTNVIVISYIDALGTLAGTGQSSGSNTYGFDKLAKSLTDNHLLTPAQAQAVQQSSAGLVSDMFASQRTDAIYKYAPQAKDFLNNLIDILEGVADVSYRGELNVERLDLNDFYSHNLMLTSQGPDRLRSINNQRQWASDLDDLDQKISAISRYRSSLEALRSAHNALVDAASRPNPDIGSVVDAYVAEFLPDVQAIQQAFAKK